MPELIWSPEALADVQRLHRLLAEKNPDAARRAAGAIRDGMQIIADHPDADRPADDMDPGFQEWSISFSASGNIALYRLQQNVALVAAVSHHKEASYQPS